MYAKGRKGTPSILDTIITCLKESDIESESSMSLQKITDNVRKRLNFNVPSSSVRAAIYKNKNLFVLDKRVNRKAYYKLNDALGNKI